MSKTRTVSKLRDILWDQLEGLKNGEKTPEDTIIMVKAADTIIDTIRLEMQYAQLQARLKEKDQPLQIGFMNEGDDAVQGSGDPTS